MWGCIMHLNEKKKSQDLRGNPSQSQAIPGPPGHCAMVLSQFPMILSGFPPISCWPVLVRVGPWWSTTTAWWFWRRFLVHNNHRAIARPPETPRMPPAPCGCAGGRPRPISTPVVVRGGPWWSTTTAVVVRGGPCWSTTTAVVVLEAEMVGNEWETTQNHRESTQDHRTMSRNPPQCLEFPGFFPGTGFFFSQGDSLSALSDTTFRILTMCPSL